MNIETAIFIGGNKQEPSIKDELSYGMTGEVKFSSKGFEFRAHGDDVWFFVTENEFQIV